MSGGDRLFITVNACLPKKPLILTLFAHGGVEKFVTSVDQNLTPEMDVENYSAPESKKVFSKTLSKIFPPLKNHFLDPKSTLKSIFLPHKCDEYGCNSNNVCED